MIRCSTWRKIALADSELWATLLLSWPMNVIKIFIERAKRVGLKIFLSLATAVGRPRIRNDMSIYDLQLRGTLIARHMTHITELYLHDGRHWDKGNLHRIITPPISDLSSLYSVIANLEAPSLRKLTILSDRVLQTETDCNRIYGLFRGHAPNLTDLDLKGVQIRLFDTPFSALTSLNITTHCRGEVLYTMNDIPFVLAQFPRLESFHLVYSPFYPHIFSSNNGPTYTHVLLPCCKSINISEMPAELMLRLFWSMEAPSLQSLRMSHPKSIDNTDKCLLRHFPPWLHNFFRDVPSLDFCFQTKGIWVGSAFERDGMRFYWLFNMPGIYNDLDIILWFIDFGEDVVLLNPERLNIRRGNNLRNSRPCQPSSSIWRGILDILPRLRMITAERNVPMEKFFRTLRDEDDEDEDYSATLLGVIDVNGAKGDKHRSKKLFLRRNGHGRRLQEVIVDLQQ